MWASFFCRLQYLPVVMAVYLPVTFFISYGMAVAYNHVTPAFPYISDTGTIPPESCVFGQLLNIYAVFALFAIVVRYKQVQHFLSQQRYKLELALVAYGHLRRLNILALVMGIFAALGISIVGNFQETNQFTVHIIGALMAFGVGGVYLWVQWFLSFFCRGGCCVGIRPATLHLRLACNIINTVCLVTMLIATKVSIDVFDGDTIRMWGPHHKGYVPHLVATISEWIMAIIVSVYFGSFYEEFKELKSHLNVKHVTMDGPCYSPDVQTGNSALS